VKEIIQSAINISTSHPEVVEKIVVSLRSLPGVLLADTSSDVDHNRTVVTLLGNGEGLERAVIEIFRVAESDIDISQHRGEHPRIGAVDVIPFTPWQGVDMEGCKKLAWRVGERVAQLFEVPVYFYAEAARVPAHRHLSFLRRGGYELLRYEIWRVPERHPDLGPARVHPTLGAVAIGARPPLLAFNVNLDTPHLHVAQTIAKKLQGEESALRYVRAIAVSLRSRGYTQVAMNILDFRKNSLLQVFEFVKLEAQRFGVRVRGAEIIGLVPVEALLEVVGISLAIPHFSPNQVLEYHLAWEGEKIF